MARSSSVIGAPSKSGILTLAGRYFAAGSSGAVTGVVILFALHFPRRTVLLFFVLPVKAWLHQADDLAGEVIREVVARNKIDPKEIADVVLGCVNQSGEDSRRAKRPGTRLADHPRPPISQPYPTLPSTRSSVPTSGSTCRLK